MKDEKWKLPSIQEYEESKSMLKAYHRYTQAESDLTASLDLLERLKAICEAEIPEFNMPDLNTFLKTFRK